MSIGIRAPLVVKMRIWLVRHGQTAYNIERRFLGVTDISLDAEGERQVARLEARFAAERLARVYSSPLSRAAQTARAIGAPILRAGLMEMDMGVLEGRTREEVEAVTPGLLRGWFHDPATFQCPGGESLSVLQARMVAQFRAICEEERQIRAGRKGELPLRDRAIAVVSHQLAITALLCGLEGVPLSGFRRFSHVNTGVTLLEHARGKTQILSLNDHSHLDERPAPTRDPAAVGGAVEPSSGGVGQ